MDPPRPAGAGAGQEEGEEEAVGPRWWGHFNEWWAPVRAENEVWKTAVLKAVLHQNDRIAKTGSGQT